MGWVSGLAVYLVIWWVLIFVVLPWGVEPIGPEDVAKGHDAGAPRRPRLVLKVAVNSLLAGVVWAIFYWAIEAGMIASLVTP